MTKTVQQVSIGIAAVAVLLLGALILLPVFSQSREMARSGGKRAPAALSETGGAPLASIEGGGQMLEEQDKKPDIEVRRSFAMASRAKAPAFGGGRASDPILVAETAPAAAVRTPPAMASIGGMLYKAQSARAPRANPNMYIASTYMGGTGARDRLEKMVREGVLVDGQRVKLEAFSHSYTQTFPIPTRTALHVTANTERSRIVQEGDHTYLQVGLQAIKGELPRRPPLNISLVIDRSGSMADQQKLENAKAAALQLVDSLHEEDTFALTAFDDSVQLLVPAQHLRNKMGIKNKIANLNPGGGTNIYEGLQSGYREAAKFASADTVNRVILLSDGEVTSGISDARAFQKLASSNAEREIQTTSVGLGLEFNEDLMMSIARDGKGNYHFIKDGADTRTVFATELNELTHVVAKAVKLRIQLAPGIGLVRVLGAKTLDAVETRQVKNEEKSIDRKVADELGIVANRQNDRDEPGIKLLIPDFYRGDSHIVMLELAVPKGSGQCKVADVFLKYKDLVTRVNQSEQAAVAIQYTADRSDMVASINRGVKKNLLGFQTGEALADAAGLMAQGNVAEAVKRVDERMVVLGLAAREWGDRDLDRDGQLLSRYETVLKQMRHSPQLAQSNLGQYVSRSLTYSGYQMTR